jgi:hypothetical protein
MRFSALRRGLPAGSPRSGPFGEGPKDSHGAGRREGAKKALQVARNRLTTFRICVFARFRRDIFNDLLEKRISLSNQKAFNGEIVSRISAVI